MSQESGDDRRSAFRVDLQCGVALCPARPELQDAEAHFSALKPFALTHEFETLSTELKALNERQQDLTTQRCISILNQQMALIFKLQQSALTLEGHLEQQTVNLSEGGCSFINHGDWQPEQRVAVALFMSDTFFHLYAFAKVITMGDATEKHRVHLEFQSISERQNQGIVRAMFQAQTRAKNSE